MSRKLIVEIIGDASSLDKTLDKTSKKTETFSTKLGGMGKAAGIAAGAAGVALLTDALKDSLEVAAADETAHAKMTTAFRNAGVSADKYAKQIDGAKDSSRELGFKNADVMDALGKLIIPTHDAGKAMDDLRIAEDLARAKHIDLGAAVKIVTGGLAGNQRAVKQLGIVIPPVTSHVDELKKAHEGIKGPIDAAALAHAKYLDKLSTGQLIIDTLSEKVRGQSAAFAETASGGMATFSAKLDDLEGKIGGALLPVLESVVTFINNNWSTMGTVIGDVFNVAKVAIENFITPMKVLWDLVHGDWGGAWDALKAPAVAAFDAVKAVIQPVIDQITGPLTTAVTAIQTTFETVWSAVSTAVTTAIDTVKTTITDAFTTAFDKAQQLGGKIVSGIASGLAAIGGAVKTKVTDAVDKGSDAFQTAYNKASDLGGKVVSGVGDGIKGAAGAVKSAISGAIGAIGDFFDNAYNKGKALASKIIGGIRDALDVIKVPGFTLEIPYPTISIGEGHKTIGVGPVSVDIPYPTFDFGVGSKSFSIPGFDPIPNFATGGRIPGAGGPVPIMAHAGEFVINAATTRALGTAFLSRLNRYDSGGPVDPETGVPFEIPLTSAVGSGAAYEIWRRRHMVAKIAKKEARILASRALYNPTRLPTPSSRADTVINAWMEALSTDPLFTERLGALKMAVDSGDLYRGGAISRSWLTYGVPKLATGGTIARSGLAFVHRGETVTPAAAHAGQIHIYLDGREITAVVETGLIARGRSGGPFSARTPA